MATTTAQGRIGHLLVKEESTLLDCVAHGFGLAPEEASRLLTLGAIYLERRRAGSDVPVTSGQYVRVHLDPKRFPVATVDWSSAVVHREEEFVVAAKPAGIPVHPTVDNRLENVLHQLGASLGMPLRITQRLDRDAGGLVVFGATREFQRDFNRLLVERNVRKGYCALVPTPPESGRYVHYMEPAERSPKTVSSEPRPGWVECVLRVVDVKSLDQGVFELSIDLETGRTHQIRAQLSSIGCPILGDTLYGSERRYETRGTPRPGIALFSTSISWRHRSKDWSFVLAPPWQTL